MSLNEPDEELLTEFVDLFVQGTMLPSEVSRSPET
jgi:hypothetical protein